MPEIKRSLLTRSLFDGTVIKIKHFEGTVIKIERIDDYWAVTLKDWNDLFCYVHVKVRR